MRKPSRRTLVIIIAAALTVILATLLSILIISINNSRPDTQVTPGTVITNPNNIGSTLPTPTGTPTTATPTPTRTITAQPTQNVNIQPTTPPNIKTPDLALASTQASIGYFQYCRYDTTTTAATHKTGMAPFYTTNSPKLGDYNPDIKTQTCQALSTTTTGSYKNGAINVHMIQQLTTENKNSKKSVTTYQVDAQMIYNSSQKTWHIQDFVQKQERK